MLGSVHSHISRLISSSSALSLKVGQKRKKQVRRGGGGEGERGQGKGRGKREADVERGRGERERQVMTGGLDGMKNDKKARRSVRGSSEEATETNEQRRG